MSDLPVACTLSPEALATRREGLLMDLLRRANAHDELDRGHRLSFAASDETVTLIARTDCRRTPLLSVSADFRSR